MFRPQQNLSPLLLVLLLLLMPSNLCAQGQWRLVRGGILRGISGMALVEPDSGVGRTSFLVVHDNKKADEPRAALIQIEGRKQPQYVPLEWPKENLPSDLEALTVVPGKPDNFIALVSSGTAFHIRLDTSRHAIEVLKVFKLPNIPDKSEFEGFALQSFGNQLVAVWGNRGEFEEVGIIYWSIFDANIYSFTQFGSSPLSVPWKAANVRHISDLKLDGGGTLYASSASDPGNDGPFDSAFYVAGTFQISNGQINFTKNPAPVRLQRFAYHKIEAFELVPGSTGGIAFGTDDENMGSSVYLDW